LSWVQNLKVDEKPPPGTGGVKKKGDAGPDFLVPSLGWKEGLPDQVPAKKKRGGPGKGIKRLGKAKRGKGGEVRGVRA